MVWRLPGTQTPLPASVVILLLPFILAQQQPLLVRADDRHGDPPMASVVQADQNIVDAPYAQFRDTHAHSQHTPVSSDDVSALATLALAGSGRAVRAPPARTSTPAGLAPQLQARSLQDWEVEDFVLLATVDGTIHARDRKTGAPRWALEVPGSPMVETIYHRPNYTDFADVRPEDDLLWIVEPSQDGNLYVYNQQHNGGLQRLGLTVKNLVDETPYSGTDPPVTYTARKETTLYTVDARTGTILRVFSSQGPMNPERSCRKVTGLEFLDVEECESSGTLTLGRVEYTVAIQNTETGLSICTIKYSEWSANNRDTDLQRQYSQTMDQRHIYSMHDGVIFGFDHSKVDGRRYTQKFSSPVARVFDVARPLNVDSADTSLVILSQPVDPPDPDYSSHGLDGRDSQVFINVTEAGGWYALSETTYPLVTGRASQAECYEKDYFASERPLMSLNPSQQKAALVGVHSLNEPHGGRRTIPSISGPPVEYSNDTPGDDSPAPSYAALPPALGDSIILRKGLDNALDIIVTLVFIVLGTFVYFNSHNLRDLAKQKLDLKNVFPPGAKPPLSSTPSTPMNASPPGRDDPKVEAVAESVDLKLNGDEQITVDLQVPHPENDGDATPKRRSPSKSADLNATPRVTIREPSRGREQGDGDVEALSLQEPEKPKKKARRGRRGGQAHKRGRKPTSEEMNKAEDTSAEDAKNTLPIPSLGPEAQLIRTVSNETIEADGALRIGQLRVYTDKVLGHGSHGTVVYKGSFDGRDVAVKRMLVEFYDIASHEVGLLQESDDHKNVIRYFCREQASGFLYIALELCPASLQELVEKPSDYPDLTGGALNLPDILRQITAGVRYLHSLKIVHRDLKPQNILVAAPKARAGSAALRLLISDFGLCKKLEDNQSSFRATTAHAAGTSGWRAPELLVDDDQNPAAWDNQPATDSSEPAVVDPQTNRRATRAIDIFSLGCVFYYVLTRGDHPFDRNGKFMREANIVKGHHNLDDLQRLGDYAYEADDLIRKMVSLDPRRR